MYHGMRFEWEADKNQSNLEQTMEEKPVQKTNVMVVASLCLMLLATLTLYPFTSRMTRMVNTHLPGLTDWWDENMDSVRVIPVSLGFGLLGVITGSLGLHQSTGKRWKAIAGIVLCSLTILINFIFAAFFMVLHRVGLQ